ncbi:hypothetical protein D9758_011680 [Tetrapyrgos nigripes]|uniref:Uncharacterized protein n=1 Tax=Tetrapyrgos nigripes TaxID=182062 RepID=A0A8H5GDD8_9AGAR|nr:hypothetical protein D9758_011680 [Tetrapyrgos nigripes]
MDGPNRMTVTKDGVEVERDEWKIWGEVALCLWWALCRGDETKITPPTELLTRRDRLRLLQRQPQQGLFTLPDPTTPSPHSQKLQREIPTLALRESYTTRCYLGRRPLLRRLRVRIRRQQVEWVCVGVAAYSKSDCECIQGEGML